MRFPTHLATALLLAVALGGLYAIQPDWSPILGSTPQDASFYTEILLYTAFLYLIAQAWQYVTGRVGSSGMFIVDMIASVVPLIVAVGIWVSHFAGGPILSEWMQTIMRVATVTVVVDLVIFGGLGALINRLTDELSRQS